MKFIEWIKEVMPSGFDYLLNDPAGIVAMVLIASSIGAVIIIFLSSSLMMYKARRVKYLGLDSAPVSALELPARLNIFDKFLIRNHKSKDTANRAYFNRMYALAIKKREMEDSVLGSQNKRYVRTPSNKVKHSPVGFYNQKN